MNKTQKYYDFLTEPIGDKDVTKVDGVDSNLGTRLIAQGFDKANTLLGQFLIMDKNKDSFSKWLAENFQASPKQCKECVRCIDDWCNQFL